MAPIAIGGTALITGATAFGTFGVGPTLGFVGQEAVESGIENVIGFPLLLDPIDLMQKGLKKTGKTVLGHIEDNYQKVAEELDASVFHFPDEVWKTLVDQGTDMTKLNMQFLDEVIKQGDDVILTRSGKRVREGSALETEIKYLLDNGYKWADENQTKLIQ